MQNLIERTLQWGINKGITGPNGKGRPMAQARKMLEEAEETAIAVRDFEGFQSPKVIEPIKDGIGDTLVTLTLLAEMYDLTLEKCLKHSLEIIEARTGKMIDGTFVKDS